MVGEKTYSEKLLENLGSVEKYLWRFYIVFMSVIVLFCVAISLKASWQDLFQAILLTIGVSFSVFLAASAVGSLLGFLFGIPKSFQRSEAGTDVVVGSPTGRPRMPDGGNGRGFFTNTSLEEISDWLTKIIIGLGLVQFESIINYIHKSSSYLSKFTMNYLSNDAESAVPFFFCIIVSALIGSCLLAYLETRTRLTLLFIGAELAFASDDRVRSLESAARPIVAEGQAAGRTVAISRTPATPEDLALAAVNRSQITDPVELAGWAAAQARVGNLVVAEDALRDALQRDPENLDIYMRITEVRRLRENYSGAFEIIVQGADKAKDPRVRAGMLHRGILTALYLPAPNGFRQAIELSDFLIREGDSVDANVHLWRTAAFGQAYKWLTGNGAPEAEKQDAKAKALEAVKAVARLRPDPNATERVLMRSMFQPSEAELQSGEDDLAVFRGGDRRLTPHCN